MNLIEYTKGDIINVVYALLILLIGLLFAHTVKIWMRKKIRSKSKDPTVRLFLVNAVYISAILMIIVSGLARLGVPTASMITVLGAGSLAIALSLKDSLSNVASGLILISLKPFNIGDTVNINGVTGTLDQINLLNIRIKASNGDYIVMPNSKVFSDKIITQGRGGRRRIDLTIGISYDADIKQAKSIIQDLLAADERVLKTPVPGVVVKELADSAVLLAVRPWVSKNDYGSVLSDLMESIKLSFDDNNIGIPYPQIEAHIKHDDRRATE